MSYRYHLRVCLLESRQSSKLYSAMKLVLVSAVFAIALLCPLAGRYTLYRFQFIPSSLQKQVVNMKTFDFMTMERAAMLRECFKYVMVRGGQLYVIMAGGKSSQLLFAVNILTTQIQVCRSASLSCFYAIPAAPLSSPNNGSWSTIGYVAKYYSTYRAPSCSYNSSILDCLTNSSYYLTSYYARYYYCRNTRDTLYIQCNFDMGKSTVHCLLLIRVSPLYSDMGIASFS